jgi:hypothetical protein
MPTLGQSNTTVQNVLDRIRPFGEIAPIFNVGGYSNEPMVTIATDVMNAICAVDFPHKWNEIVLPVWYANSYQQDYAGIYPSGASIYNLEWLERGAVFDISDTSIPKPFRAVECGRQLPQASGSFFNTATSDPLFLVNWFPNSTLYFGTWGAGNVGTGSLGNNPVAGSVYTNPTTAAAMPSNPITQIEDANGNLLLLTQYGTEGTTAPLAAVGALPGTTVAGAGASTIWTVVDPAGVGYRILPVPSQTGNVWQFNLVGQMPPVQFTSLSQTLAPLPDRYEPVFRMGCVAQAYRYSPEAKVRAKFADEWKMWLAGLNDLRAREDRELEENSFSPERSIMGRQGRGISRWPGSGYPFNLPGSGF